MLKTAGAAIQQQSLIRPTAHLISPLWGSTVGYGYLSDSLPSWHSRDVADGQKTILTKLSTNTLSGLEYRQMGLGFW